MTLWVPSSLCAVKMCGVLLIAHRREMIHLSYLDALRVRDVLLRPRQCQKTRMIVAKLWARHKGLSLSKELNRYEAMPQKVVDELQAQESA